MADSSSRTADVGARYAQALFELADEAKMIAVAEDDLKSLKAMSAGSADLRRLIASPAFSAEDKAKALLAIADKAHLNPLTKRFLGLLGANNRIAALPAVITAFERLTAERRGAVAAEVTSAIELTSAQEKTIAAALKQAFGKDPEITTSVDPALLGGLKVKVGSKLSTRLLSRVWTKLEFALKRA